MKKIYIKIILAVILLFFCFIAFLFYNGTVTKQKKEQVNLMSPTVKINDIIIPVKLANTSEKRIKGLSGSKELNGGMLFLFNDIKIRNFWMKNMNFPIDIIWIKDEKIVNISKNLQPEGEKPKKTYSSIYPVNYVLEVNGGFTNQNKIKIGDKLKFIK